MGGRGDSQIEAMPHVTVSLLSISL